MTPQTLKTLMKQHKLDARGLSKLVKLHESTISRYLSGEVEISEKNAQYIKLVLASCK